MGNPISRRELMGAGLAAGTMAAGEVRARTRQKGAGSEMHLGIVTYNVAKDWDLQTILKTCRETGIEGVEFRTTHRHGVEPTLTAAQRKSVRQQCLDAGLLQVSLGTICEFHSPDQNVVNRNIQICREFVDLAKDIGARGVKVRPNGAPREVPLEKTLEQIGAALRECGKIGADSGVEIWMEVHGATTMLCPNARKIMDHCAHPNVGVTWNSNSTDVADGSVRESFTLLRPYIRCCHITELWSDYPYRELFGLLNRSSYDRFALCEVGSSMQPEDGVTFLRCYRGLWKELSRV